MKTSDAIKHFKTKSAIARALRINRSAVTLWGEKVPARRAFELERLTKGKLQASFPVSHEQVNTTKDSGV